MPRPTRCWPLAPDVVIVATGGLPDTSFLEAGEDLVTSVWDVLGGYVELGGSVLLYDDHGWHQGPSTAVALAKKGVAGRAGHARPHDRLRGRGHQLPATILRELYRHGVKLTPDLELRSVRRERQPAGRRLLERVCRGRSSSAWSTMSWSSTAPCRPTSSTTRSRTARATAARSTSRGWLAGRGRRDRPRNPDGSYLLYRVGDAVASRNIHAAIYDALRLCKGL